MARQSPRSKPAPTGPPKGKSAHLIVGELGETLVSDWIRDEGGTVLAERWHCVTGELDIVAQLPPEFAPSGLAGSTETLIAFIEVKTRRRGTWDAGGLLAITPQKQGKLWRTAQFFLKKHPQFRSMPCRFDVALVQCRKLRSSRATEPSKSEAENRLPSSGKQPVKLGEAVMRGEHCLTLQQYVVDAFTM